MTMVGGALHTVDDLLAPFAAPVVAPAFATRAVPAVHDHEVWWHEPEWAHRYCC
jgi:hypothetical protein